MKCGIGEAQSDMSKKPAGHKKHRFVGKIAPRKLYKQSHIFAISGKWGPRGGNSQKLGTRRTHGDAKSYISRRPGFPLGKTQGETGRETGRRPPGVSPGGKQCDWISPGRTGGRIYSFHQAFNLVTTLEKPRVALITKDIPWCFTWGKPGRTPGFHQV